MCVGFSLIKSKDTGVHTKYLTTPGPIHFYVQMFIVCSQNWRRSAPSDSESAFVSSSLFFLSQTSSLYLFHPPLSIPSSLSPLSFISVLLSSLISSPLCFSPFLLLPFLFTPVLRPLSFFLAYLLPSLLFPFLRFPFTLSFITSTWNFLQFFSPSPQFSFFRSRVLFPLSIHLKHLKKCATSILSSISLYSVLTCLFPLLHTCLVVCLTLKHIH
jgi:hypothetical protein